MRNDTTETETTDESTDTRDTMAEVSHTNPYTDEPFGDVCAFQRGPVVAADGGERNAGPAADEDADGTSGGDARTMADVDHEHPHADDAAANRVFERGNEHDVPEGVAEE